MSEGARLRDEGVLSVLDNSSEAWKAEARMVMGELVDSGEPFTSEDLIERMVLRPHHPNAVGGFWIGAVKNWDLIIVGYTKADKPTSRKHILPLWVAKGGQFDGTV